MIAADVFRDQAVLTGANVRLEPLASRHFDGLWPMFGEREGMRLTGTHETFTEEQIRGWLATRQDHHDRVDWAIVLIADDAVVGEAVLNDLDVAGARTRSAGSSARASTATRSAGTASGTTRSPWRSSPRTRAAPPVDGAHGSRGRVGPAAAVRRPGRA